MTTPKRVKPSTAAHMVAPAQTLINRTGDRPPRGLLWIGDPHVWSRCPGRRRDESFLSTVIGKLEAVAVIANDLDLQPLIGGDLLHDDEDNDTQMLISLARALQAFDRKPVTLVGNHDKDDLLRLSERNPLLLLSVTGQIDLIDTPSFWGQVCLESPDGKEYRMAIGGTPYGHPIPTDIDADFPQLCGPDGTIRSGQGVDAVLWLTHEDLAFGDGYPGAFPLHEIKGADMVINGHMHASLKPHRYGDTAWYNPGNITRLSVDQAEHRPMVWRFDPFDQATQPSAEGLAVPILHGEPLPHRPGRDVFDFTGRHATSDKMAVHDIPEGSAFVEGLRTQVGERRTDEAVALSQALPGIFEALKTPAHTQPVINDLFMRARKQVVESS